MTEYAIFSVSPDGRVLTWNPGAERTFGYAERQILGNSVDLLFTPEDLAAGQPGLEFAAAEREGVVHRDCWHLRRDRTRFWATNTVQPLRDEFGGLAGFSKIVRDSTERYLAAVALRESEERFRLLTENVGDYAIFAMSAVGAIELWNAGAAHLFGYSAAEVVGRHFSLMFVPDDVLRGDPEVELSQAAAHGFADADRWYARKNGTRFFATGKLTRLAQAPAGTPRGFVKIIHDITERKHQEEVMRYEAFHDRLTGLPNRALFLEHLQRVLAHVERFRARRFGLLFLDIDQFKDVNDRFGHARADLLLIEIGRRLDAVVRPEDVVARYGGDEFTILLTDIDQAEQAVGAANAVRDAFAQPIVVDDREIAVTASVGIAIGSAAYDRPEHVIRDADLAMYVAKALGRNRSVVFDEGMRHLGVARKALESEIRHAIERSEFFVEYQPIVSLATSLLVGFEALVRWRHPMRGSLLPSEFVSAAEQAGLLIAIDGLVLETACRQLAAWQNMFRNDALTMHVNQSGHDFSRPDVLTRVGRTLEQFEIAPRTLRLELSERVAMDPSRDVFEQLALLRDLGVEFSIDEFGTGNSGLGSLRRFGARSLKVDRSFVSGMMKSAEKCEIVRTAITLAHNFHLTSIAVGVETLDEAAALAEMTCDLAQGEYFSQPLDVERATSLVRRGEKLPAA